MFKLLTATVFLLSTTCCFAQNIAFRVSPQLTVFLPAEPDSVQMNGVKVYTVLTDTVVYQLGTDTKEVKVRNRKDFEDGLRGFYSGYSKKLQNGFTLQKMDTTIGGVKGAFLFAISRDTSETAKQFFQFYTIVNKHLHFMQCTTSANKPAMTGVNQFFLSAKFRGKNYPSDDTQSLAFRIGEVLGFLMVIGIICLFVYFVVSLIDRSGNKKS